MSQEERLSETIGRLEREVEQLKDAAYGRPGECLDCYLRRRVALNYAAYELICAGRCRCRTSCWCRRQNGVGGDGKPCVECVDPSVRPMGPDV